MVGASREANELQRGEGTATALESDGRSPLTGAGRVKRRGEGSATASTDDPHWSALLPRRTTQTPGKGISTVLVSLHHLVPRNENVLAENFSCLPEAADGAKDTGALILFLVSSPLLHSIQQAR